MMEPLPDIIVYPLTSPTYFQKMLPLKTEPWQDLHIFITTALLYFFLDGTTGSRRSLCF